MDDHSQHARALQVAGAFVDGIDHALRTDALGTMRQTKARQGPAEALCVRAKATRGAYHKAARSDRIDGMDGLLQMQQLLRKSNIPNPFA